MDTTIKMPNGGYDIKVVRKEDICNCIEDNIIDKDVMLAFINQLEVDATNFLSQGRWTSLPYIGTLRKNQYKAALNSKEVKELDEAAKETLDKKKYIIFRKDLRNDIAIGIKRERIYKYTLSKMVNKNRKYYKHLEETKGEIFARVICFTLSDISTDYEL